MIPIKVWYKAGILRHRVGIITDLFLNYVELKDIEDDNYIIKHISEIEFIN